MATSEKQIVRRLTAAEGFIELQLPEMALHELSGIEEPGRFILPCLWLTSESLKQLQRFDEAATVLNQMVDRVPGQFNQPIKDSLRDCLERLGRDVPPELVPSTEPVADAAPAADGRGEETSRVLNVVIPSVGKIAVEIGKTITVSFTLDPQARGTPPETPSAEE